jgi:hypothetical protein
MPFYGSKPTGQRHGATKSTSEVLGGSSGIKSTFKSKATPLTLMGEMHKTRFKPQTRGPTYAGHSPGAARRQHPGRDWRHYAGPIAGRIVTAEDAAAGGTAPIGIDWQDPMPVDQAIGQPDAGIFIVEQIDGQPVHVGAAPDGFGVRLQGLPDELQRLSLDPQGVQVRLGVVQVRPGNPADRAVLSAVAHDAAARIRATGASGFLDASQPTPREQRLLEQRPVQNSGAVPDYLST